MRNGLQVAVDINRMRTAVSTLLSVSTSPNSRANLITIQQVLSTYRPHRVGAVKMISKAPTSMVEVFQRLVGIPLYQELSHNVWAMGRVGEAEVSATKVTQTARLLVEQDEALQFGRRSTFIPSETLHLSSPAASEYFDMNYFPPIISFKRALNNAKSAWAQLTPSFVPIGMHPKAERFRVSRSNNPH